MPHACKQILFVLLSLADLALTCWLLGHSDGAVFEANPVASWWLQQHGWVGLLCFKAAVVCLVVGLAGVIALTRPRAAGRLLGLGCACLALVVLYSATLCRAAARTPEERQAEREREFARDLAEMNRQADQELRQMQAFWALRVRLCQDVLARRCTLRQAVQQVAESERAKTGPFLHGLATRFPDLTPEQRLAAWLIASADMPEDRTPAAERTAGRLKQVFQRTYGRYPPTTLGPAEEAGDAGQDIESDRSSSFRER